MEIAIYLLSRIKIQCAEVAKPGQRRWAQDLDLGLDEAPILVGVREFESRPRHHH